jgi:hypothetical protein
VDDFFIKYVGKDNAHHLHNALLHNYGIITDLGGTVYSGMTLKWDYHKRTCDISMPGYITNVLNKFQHDAPKYPQHTPSKCVTSIYGAKTQYATRDETPLLSAKQCTNMQNIPGSVFYYARAVDPTVIMPLNDIATEQINATEKTQVAENKLLDYLATHTDATVRYHKSDMILDIHSDASYLSISHAHIILGGLFYCGDKPSHADKLNGSILNAAAVIKNAVKSRPRVMCSSCPYSQCGKYCCSSGISRVQACSSESSWPPVVYSQVFLQGQ